MLSEDELFIGELLRVLQSADLEAIIIGMAAAALQGAPITTQDVDVLVRDTPKNREKVQAVAHELGAVTMQVSSFTSTLTLVGSAVPVDIIFEEIPGGLKFESLRARSARVQLGERVVLVASLEDIIRSKEAAARPKDLAQLPILYETLRVRLALGQSDHPKR